MLIQSRVVESESGVGVGGVACFQLESESESVFKTAGVGVRSRSRIFKTAGVGVGSRSQESESEHLLQLPTPMFIE